MRRIFLAANISTFLTKLGSYMLSLKNVLIKILGNGFMQRWLEKNVNISQYFMGIGSGGDVVFSGESAIFDILKRRTGSSCCIFDVGANKGQFLQVILENLAVEKYVIHCFEPGHETFKALVDSFQHRFC
jgi:hypothetical protein